MSRFAHATLEVVPAEAPERAELEQDRVVEAMERLREALPPRTDNAVIVDLLEDDLREGLDGLAEIDAHFDELLETLISRTRHGGSIVESADAQRALAALDRVCDSLQRVQKRLSVAAARLAG